MPMTSLVARATLERIERLERRFAPPDFGTREPPPCTPAEQRTVLRMLVEAKVAAIEPPDGEEPVPARRATGYELTRALRTLIDRVTENENEQEPDA